MWDRCLGWIWCWVTEFQNSKILVMKFWSNTTCSSNVILEDMVKGRGWWSLVATAKEMKKFYYLWRMIVLKKRHNNKWSSRRIIMIIFHHLLLYNRVIVLEVCIVIATILTSLNLIRKECKYKKDYLVEECKSWFHEDL